MCREIKLLFSHVYLVWQNYERVLRVDLRTIKLAVLFLKVYVH